MSAAAAPAVVNGWTLFAYPLFLSQVDALATEGVVAKNRRYGCKNFARHQCACALPSVCPCRYSGLRRVGWDHLEG